MSFELHYDEACDVYERQWHVARKPHRCQCCGYLIPAGAQYERHHWVDEGTAGDEACCWSCAAGLWLLLQAYRWHPSPRWAVECLREEVSDAMPERGALERDVLAGMLRRSRAALRERR